MIVQKRISEPLYRKILEVMPVACVDAVIVNGHRFLLGKRIHKPAKGQWFLVGGRVLKGEALEDAVRRHIKDETGASDIKIRKMLTTAPTIFRNSAHNSSTHTINSVFLTSITKKGITAGVDNEKLGWFSRIDTRWHPYVRRMLRLAGFR